MQTIYFDGACPICSKEVAFYRKYSDRKAEWIDVSILSNDETINGKSRDDLLAIMHIRQENGQWLTAIDAFAAMWQLVPFLRPFAWVFTVLPLKPFWMLAYKLFLKYRNRVSCDKIHCS